mmetsp:Transcript_106554/g.189454  ORF Transcript_106554/g.189454 Transcript_106554/m.189454 type:complete len:104 (+) Transcript_106554:1475-1786(+)
MVPVAIAIMVRVAIALRVLAVLLAVTVMTMSCTMFCMMVSMVTRRDPLNLYVQVVYSLLKVRCLMQNLFQSLRWVGKLPGTCFQSSLPLGGLRKGIELYDECW